MGVQPAAGTTISIGTTASDPTGDSYTLIGSLSALPEMGDEYDDVVFENLGTKTYEHNTGAKNAASIQLGIGRDLVDSGQAALLAANGVNSWYNFKVIYPDATIDYFKAKVQGYRTAPGGMTGNLMATVKLQPQPGQFDLANSAAAPTNTLVPSIAGVAAENEVLTAVPGVWTGAPTFTYQWKRDGSNISGATSATYTLVTADVAATITVAVTGTNAAGNATATSAGLADITGA